MRISTGTWKRLQAAERRELCETLRRAGPASPTLCDRWTAADIAAHLVVSEALGGIPLGATYPVRRVVGARVAAAGLRRVEGVGQRLMERAQRRGWDWMLHRLAAGPPALYAVPSLARIRILEAWIHHEDVRRASDPSPRSSTAEFDEALLDAMQWVVRMPELAASRGGVRAVLPDGRAFETGGDVRLSVSGPPGEILLWVTGRGSVAQVAVDGDREQIEAFTAGLAF